MVTDDYLQKFGLELIDANVGQGGSAVVHKCRRLDMPIQGFPSKGAFVAVKEFRPEMLATPGQLQRIEQEAAIGLSVASEHLAKIYAKDVGEGVPPAHCVLFMEWIGGSTLFSWTKNRKPNRPVPWETMRSVCLQIVKGVQQLHDAGIHHRDLKTENIMLRSGTQPVIMDVGVAEIARGAEHTMHTRVKDFLGSVRYASPQFLRGEEFDSSDDVYSLGCTFLELLTGQQPYHQEERKVLLPSIVMHGPPDVPNSISASAPGLDILIRGCTHPDRSRRPTLSELAEFFEASNLTDYVNLERVRQYEDQNGWPVLQVDKYEIYLDLASRPVIEDREFKVVRLGKPILVPSTGQMHIPQRLIGKAKHLHTSGTLAHFRFTPDIDARISIDAKVYGLPSPTFDMVEVGDRVVV
jgi:serine/threonine protein kinase